MKKNQRRNSKTANPRKKKNTSENREQSVDRNIRLCNQCGINPVHYNLSVCYDCEYYAD